MHTYLKDEKDRVYWVGIWAPTKDDATFWRLFSVPSLKQAIVAVNCLNGGSRISPDALHIIEETYVS